jgi:hypothetical protein
VVDAEDACPGGLRGRIAVRRGSGRCARNTGIQRQLSRELEGLHHFHLRDQYCHFLVFIFEGVRDAFDPQKKVLLLLRRACS